nr:MAG TPA: hypothetical protein [Caudoviricetes sp.]
MVASRAVGMETSPRLLCVHRDLLLLVAWVLRLWRGPREAPAAR